MYYIIYLTTNIVNNKIYIGKHSTYNLNDSYLGSGELLIKAIKKYGKENFKRTIIHYCYDEHHMNELEKFIVDVDFIKRKNVYNICLGGQGGNLIINKTLDEIKFIRSKAVSTMNNKSNEDKLEYKLKLSNASKNTMHLRPKFSQSGKAPKSEEHKEKIRQSNLNKKHNISEEGKRRAREAVLAVPKDKKTNRRYKLTDPQGKEIYSVGNLMSLCKEYSLSYSTLHKNVDKGIIKMSKSPRKGYNSPNGWRIDDISS